MLLDFIGIVVELKTVLHRGLQDKPVEKDDGEYLNIIIIV